MQIDKTIKVLLFTFPLVMLTSCSRSKECIEEITPLTTPSSQAAPLIETPAEQLYAEEQERQLESLKQNNLVLFNFDKCDIQPEFSQILDMHATYLRDNPSCKIVIEGHTDERGSPEYNIGLGERRAKAVAAYLQSNGVLEDQISICSYGEEKPAIKGHDDEAHRKNRRAVLVY